MEYQNRVKTPTIIQMEAVECGATSLSIILAYYGRYITPEDARLACGISRDGSKAINIIKAARNYGLDADGANIEIEDLDEIKVPFIAFWDFNHFLIVEGYNKKSVFLNDPALGPRTIDWKEFDSKFTGVVLDLKPGASFQKGGIRPPNVLRLLFDKLGHNKITLLFIVLVTLALLVPKIASPIYTKMFVDQVLNNNQHELLKVVLFGIGFTTLAGVFITWLQKKMLNKLNFKLDMVTEVNFIWHLLHIPIHYFQQRSSGDITQRITISATLTQILAKDLPLVGVGLLEMAFFLVVIFLQSWQIGFCLSFFLAVNYFIVRESNQRFSDLSMRLAQDTGKLESIQVNGIQIIESIKASALENHFFDRWISYYTKFLKTQSKIFWLESIITSLPSVLNLVLNIIIITLGAFLVMEGQLTVGSIIAIQAILVLFFIPYGNLNDFLSKLQKLKGELLRLNDVMDTSVDIQFSDNPDLVQDIASLNHPTVLQVKNLTFGFSPLEAPMVYNVSLEVCPGQRVALVGRSGSGKSSITKLICGLNNPWSGEIYLNGVLLQHCSRHAMSKYIAYVDQNILFFQDSIRNNLTMWDASISDEDIIGALKKVHMYNLIMERGGLGLMLNETGNNFSGGQRQCLEIARALLKNPKFLILDEATSALDPKLEHQIYKSLKEEGCTVFVVAHRLSAVMDSDKIFVLSQGEIVQSGTHEELAKQQGIYLELISAEGM